MNDRELERIPKKQGAPLAIVNIRHTSRPELAIKYFANPAKVTGRYDGLETGVAVGTPRELADLLLASHHDRRVSRNCRTAVLSVQTPENATPRQLADIDGRLLKAASELQVFLKVASMLGWIHGNTTVRHMHVIFPNSDKKRTLNLTPKLLRDMQSMLWTCQFRSGRGRGKGRAIPGYCNYLKLALSGALYKGGVWQEERWQTMVDAGVVTNLRSRENGSLISFEFRNRRFRLNSLKSFLTQPNPTQPMTTELDVSKPIPAPVLDTLNEAGFTSEDVQAILADIREAMAHVAPAMMTKQTPTITTGGIQ